MSSLNFVTEQDLAVKTKELEKGLEQDGVIGVVGQLGVKLGNWIKGKVQGVGDKLHTNTDYYDFEEPVLSMAKVEEVLAGEHGRLRAIEEAAYSRVGIEEASEAREESQINVVESIVEQEMLARSSLSSQNLAKEEAKEKTMTATAQLGGKVAAQGKGSKTVAAGIHLENGIKDRTNRKQTAKERFYQGADSLRERERFIRDYKAEFESLKHELKFSYERIVTSLLGEPNKALSNNGIYRYGKKGSLAVTMRGSRAGTWRDFEAGEGGDMIALVQRETGQDFKASTEYLKSMLGISRHATLKLVHDDRAVKQYAEAVAEDSKEQERQRKETEKVKGLYEKAKGIGDRSVAYRYLSEQRHISIEPGKDVKTTRVWDKSTSKHYPAIVAFARNAAGEVTGGQTILLDPETATKASADIVKRSFGKVGGSFVGLQVPIPAKHTALQSTLSTSTRNSITFIAEGLETALSIKEAGIAREGDKILCSLGISNIKNYQPQLGERIMLSADNDGEGAKTNQTTLKARSHLEELGAIVHVIQPKELGDFNDVLKAWGVEGIREQLEPAVKGLRSALSMQEKEQVKVAEEFLRSHEGIWQEAKTWSSKIASSINMNSKEYEQDLLGSLAPLSEEGKLKYLQDVRNKAMSQGLKEQLNRFMGEKMQSITLEELKPYIVKEQEFLKEVYQNKEMSRSGEYPYEISQILSAGETALQSPKDLEKVFREAKALVDTKLVSEMEVTKVFHDSISTKILLRRLESEKEYHWRNTVLPELERGVDKANTARATLQAIQKREEFLASLHGNLKHSSFDKVFTTAVNDAHKTLESQMMEKLKEVAHEHITYKVSKEEDLSNLLKQNTDIKATYQILDKALERHKISGKLSSFSKTIEETKTPEEVIKVIAAREEYLSSLHGNLKYQDHGADLMSSIEAAYGQKIKGGHDNAVQATPKLQHLVQHATKHGVMSEEQAIKTLKNSKDLAFATAHLTTICQDHHLRTVKENIEKIREGHQLEIGGHKFNDPLKYLEHEIAKPTREYSNIQSLHKLQLQLQKQLEFKMQMHGPSL